jgi:hypothetical protein
LDSDAIHEELEAAKELSTKCQTKVITLSEEDTSGLFGYELCDRGELVEEFDDAEWILFSSKLRSTPEFFVELDEEEKEECYYDIENNNVYDSTGGFDRIKFVDKLYRELGIYLPDCYPVEDDGKLGLAVGKASENTIERADLLFIEEILELND